MSFLELKNKKILVLGVANKKSIAWKIAKTLEDEGTEVIYSVRSESRKQSLETQLANRSVFVCDVEYPEQIELLAAQVSEAHGAIDGIVHAIAFANYSDGFKPFDQTKREDFLQATAISSFSLVEVSRAFKPHLNKDASIVTIGISSQVTAENYGYMAPIKASLESSVRFLAKSFSKDSQVRFNSVNSGPVKTSASAGIPGFLNSYIYAEQLTFRKKALDTQEVANTAVFLLSPRSSGINGQGVTVNAGMDLNYFDKEVIEKAVKIPSEPSAQKP